ncbi:MAG: hypothetical protein Kow0074_21640 [Candidatus Zixiibacteriota bacterium]
MSHNPPSNLAAPNVETDPTTIQLLKALLSVWQAAAIYDQNNNAFRSRRRAFREALNAAAAGSGTCRIEYQGGYIFFNGTRLNYDREFSFGRALAFRFGGLRLGELSIRADVEPEKLDQALFALAQTDTRLDDPFEALQETWATLGIEGIAIGRMSEVPDDDLNDETEAEREARRRRRAHALVQRAESVVHDMWDRIRDRNSFDAPATQRVVHLLIDQIAHDEPALMEFASLREFDEYTYYHSVCVAIYSIAVGLRLGFNRHRLTQLGIAALFHDIGKVKLSKDLITKPDEYNEDDWVEIKRHPILGALTLANLKHIDADTAVAMAGAFEHHLRMDMTGYPELSAPRTLHVFSRIIALCDAFDAMTSGRVYQKDHISPDEALRRLIHKGRQWYDPIIVKALVHVLGVFPVGTLVRLSDQSTAIVMKCNADDLYAPDVLVIRDSDGMPVRRSLRVAGRDREEAVPHILEVLNPQTEMINVEDYIALNYQVSDDVTID